MMSMNKTISGRTIRSFIAILSSLVIAMVPVNPVSVVTSVAATTTEVSSWQELYDSIEKLTGSKETAFKLSKDITAGAGDHGISIPAGRKVSIDLAGHTMSRGLSEMTDKGYVISVATGSALTLTDTTETPGIIGGGANNGNGGGILCDDTAKLSISGGISIQGNRARYGGGICLGSESELKLGDCAITENEASVNGGGIYAGSSYISFLGGVTKVKKNTKDGANNDLYLPTEMNKLQFYTWSSDNVKTRKKESTKEFDRGTSIGILLEEMTKEISDGYGQVNQYAANNYFYYDTDEYVISDDTKKSEVTIVKNTKSVNNSVQTVLETYKNGKLKSSKKYDSFIAAYNAGAGADGENVVVMGSDHESDSEIVLDENKEITIDLNGHYIKRNRDHKTKKNGGVIRVEKGAKLTIRDSNPKKKGYDGVKGGVITGGASSNYGGGITVKQTGQLIMEGGTIYDCVSDEDGGGVYMDSGSTDTSFTMTGGRIYNCRALESTDECYGGGIYLGEGKLSLSNGTIDGCYSEDDGGAIYSKRGEIHLDNMTFSGNKATNRGGGIYLGLDLAKYVGTTFYATGCKFLGNISSEDGGAFFLRDNPEHGGSVMFDHCVFRDNKAAEDGGAICVFDDGMVLSNVTVTDNHAGNYGGGVFVDSRYTISLKGVVVIQNNSCDKDPKCIDLALEEGTSTSAKVVSAGLSRGSWIGVGSTGSGRVKISDRIGVQEMKYFHAHNKTIKAENVVEVDADMVVTASIFGNGKVWLMFLMMVFGLVASMIMGWIAGKRMSEDK